MSLAEEYPTRGVGEEEQERGDGDGYPAKRQRLVHQFPRDGPANSVPTTPTILEREPSLTALSSAQKVLAYSSALQDTHAEHNGTQFEGVVEFAKSRAIDIGHPELADAIDEIYERSRLDKILRNLLSAVLTRNATPAQENQFQHYARLARNTTKDAHGDIRPADTLQSSAPTSYHDNQSLVVRADSSNFVDSALSVSERGKSAQSRHDASTSLNLTAAEANGSAAADLVCFGMVIVIDIRTSLG